MVNWRRVIQPSGEGYVSILMTGKTKVGSVATQFSLRISFRLWAWAGDPLCSAVCTRSPWYKLATFLIPISSKILAFDAKWLNFNILCAAIEKQFPTSVNLNNSPRKILNLKVPTLVADYTQIRIWSFSYHQETENLVPVSGLEPGTLRAIA